MCVATRCTVHCNRGLDCIGGRIIWGGEEDGEAHQRRRRFEVADNAVQVHGNVTLLTPQIVGSSSSSTSVSSRIECGGLALRTTPAVPQLSSHPADASAVQRRLYLELAVTPSTRDGSRAHLASATEYVSVFQSLHVFPQSGVVRAPLVMETPHLRAPPVSASVATWLERMHARRTLSGNVSFFYVHRRLEQHVTVQDSTQCFDGGRVGGVDGLTVVAPAPSSAYAAYTEVSAPEVVPGEGDLLATVAKFGPTSAGIGNSVAPEQYDVYIHGNLHVRGQKHISHAEEHVISDKDMHIANGAQTESELDGAGFFMDGPLGGNGGSGGNGGGGDRAREKSIRYRTAPDLHPEHGAWHISHPLHIGDPTYPGSTTLHVDRIVPRTPGAQVMIQNMAVPETVAAPRISIAPLRIMLPAGAQRVVVPLRTDGSALGALRVVRQQQSEVVGGVEEAPALRTIGGRAFRHRFRTLLSSGAFSVLTYSLSEEEEEAEGEGGGTEVVAVAPVHVQLAMLDCLHGSVHWTMDVPYTGEAQYPFQYDRDWGTGGNTEEQQGDDDVDSDNVCHVPGETDVIFVLILTRITDAATTTATSEEELPLLSSSPSIPKMVVDIEGHMVFSTTTFTPS